MAQEFRIQHRFVNDQIGKLWLAIRNLEAGLQTNVTARHRVITGADGGGTTPGGCCDYHYAEPPGGTNAMDAQDPGRAYIPESAHRYVDFWVHTSNYTWWETQYPEFDWIGNIWYPHIRSDMTASPGEPGGDVVSLGGMGYKFLATTRGDWRPQPHDGEFAMSDAWCWVFGDIQSTIWGVVNYEPYISVGTHNEIFPPHPGEGFYYNGGVSGYTGSPWVGPISPTHIGSDAASEIYPWSPFPGYDQMYFVDLGWNISDTEGQGATTYPIGSCEDHYADDPDALALWIYNFNAYMAGGTNPTEASEALVFLHLEWKPVVPEA